MTDTVGAIIVAAGSSIRMGGTDKLFADLAGRPLLARTIEAFERCEAIERIVLVLSSANLERGRGLVAEGVFTKVAAICEGGARRQDSVRLGLEALGECDYVAVHDGARPLVTPELIERGIAAARESGAAVPAIAIADTVKEADADGRVVRTLDRSRLYAVQTPQVFRYDLLMRAHREVTADATDDAAMLEELGVPVKVFEGERRNIKITTAEDLVVARSLIQAMSVEPGLILHITTRTAWEQAKSAGSYRGDTIESEGFIHCSTPAQVLGVANSYFRGQRDLILLSIDSRRVRPDIRWEGELFPHIYGSLNLEAVTDTVHLEPDENGLFNSSPDLYQSRISSPE